MKVFFDVDGVLIEGWHANDALRKRWDATLEADMGIDSGAFRKLLFDTQKDQLTSLMSECSTGRRDLKDALADVLPKAGYQGTTSDFIRYWFEKDSNLNADVFGLVQDIKKGCCAEMYLATAQEHHRARYLWNELGLSKHFDGMFYSANIGYPKQDVRFFEAINNSLGIDPGEQPPFFDDRPDIVEIANGAGWDGVVFSSIADIQTHPQLRHLWQ